MQEDKLPNADKGSRNMVNLPLEFREKMKDLLGSEEYELFINSYSDPSYKGIRINTLKVSVNDFMEISPFDNASQNEPPEKIPWAVDGFYLSDKTSALQPGKHPYYKAGLYYIQEPSAMFPAGILRPSPAENVLDLCAAPGGKTMQLAAFMKGAGFLLANEINADRAKALVKNVEMYGLNNVMVTNESSGKLAGKFKGFFDKILVDAPCSGEGMFKKDENAIKSWEKYKCRHCAELQEEILEDANEMLKPGGCLAYSTCTFSPLENECVISNFINKHPNYSILEIPKSNGISDGILIEMLSDKNFCDKKRSPIGNTARLWPHKIKGEGHYAALLKKSTATSPKPASSVEPSSVNLLPEYRTSPPDEFLDFEKNTLTKPLENIFDHDHHPDNNKGRWYYYTSIPKNDPKCRHLYYLPKMLDMSGIKVVKQGLYLGECKNGKFKPSHSFACTLKKSQFKNRVDFPSHSPEISGYLKCETPTFPVDFTGYGAFCVDGFPLGWIKASGGIIKNLYPKGWRTT